MKTLISFILLTFCSLSASAKDATKEFDYGNYLSNFDLIWNTTPTAYEQGAFLGNGEQGTNIWAAQGETLHFDIGDTRVYDEKSRAPIGKFVLKTLGKTKTFTMRLSLWDAEVIGNIATDKGEIKFKAISHAKQNLNLVEFTVSGEEEVSVEHITLPLVETGNLYNELRTTLKKQGKSKEQVSFVDFTHPDIYPMIATTKIVKGIPEEITGELNNLNYRSAFSKVKNSKNEFDSGYTLTWGLQKTGAKTYLLAWRTDFARTGFKHAPEQTTKQLQQAINQSSQQRREQHVAWWHNYYNSSFISLPEKRIESNYYLQIYKMASATRAGSLPIDLMGPWHRATPWARIWANLNVQLSYLPQAVANKKSIAQTLPDFMDLHFDSFVKAIPEKFQHNSAGMGRGMSAYGFTKHSSEYGNFLWMLYDYQHFLRVYPDTERSVNKFYPLLKRGLNFIIHNLVEGDDGVLHTPKDISPEYKVKGKFPKVIDTTYNLEMLRWGLNVALDINEANGLKDAQVKKYQEVLAKLAKNPIDDSGLMIGKDVSVTVAHRHYSHLVGLYPLRQMDLDNAPEYSLAKKSVDHWLGQKVLNNWSYKGYSRTGGTAMYTMLDRPELAIEQLNMFMDSYLTANGFYLETGPVIETPLSSAAVIQELLIQSWQKIDSQSAKNKTNLIRLFPGVPNDWPQASFDQLRAEGGYVVSAQNELGLTTAFSVTAEKAGNLELRLKGNVATKISASLGSKITQAAYTAPLNNDNTWTSIKIDLQAGEVLTFGNVEQFRVQALGKKGDSGYHFGVIK